LEFAQISDSIGRFPIIFLISIASGISILVSIKLTSGSLLSPGRTSTRSCNHTSSPADTVRSSSAGVYFETTQVQALYHLNDKIPDGFRETISVNPPETTGAISVNIGKSHAYGAWYHDFAAFDDPLGEKFNRFLGNITMIRGCIGTIL
jgi:hypothetical protein